MTHHKRNTLSLLGIPHYIVLPILGVIALISISPYIPGADFGTIKVPVLPETFSQPLKFVGPLLCVFGIMLFVRFWKDPTKPTAVSPSVLDSDSKYHLQNIEEIVKAEASREGIHIEQIRIADRLHIDDLERMCTKVISSEKAPHDVHRILHAARAKAFGRKYAEPREDEKLADPASIAIDGIRPSHAYLADVLRDRGIDDLNRVDMLYVGIGNGHADRPFLNGAHSFKAVDISPDALAYAKKIYPQMIAVNGMAEDLNGIATGSIDLYLSLRVFQSTLLHRRSAVHEAYRVLRIGGVALVSVPTLYLRKDATVLHGLQPPSASEPSMQYAEELVARTAGYFDVLNFRKISIDKRSPFEIFISAVR